MGDAMDGVIHGQRPIATPRPRIKKTVLKKTSKRKSAGGSTESSSATSLNPTPSKKLKVATTVEGEQNWTTIAQNHAALLDSHANFLSSLLAQSQPTSARTPALVGFLSRTHEMLAQVKTIEAISPPIPTSPAKPAPNSSLPRQHTSPKNNTKMEGLSENLSSIALANKKRPRNPSPSASPEKLEGREDSPIKKIKSAPETPVGGLKNSLKSSLKSKLGIRTAPRTPTVVTASTSEAPRNFSSAKQKQEEKETELKTEMKEEENGEVSLMEPDDFAAEVAARLKAKERRKHKLVEGSRGKRRRRSSTVDVGERREKRIKRESLDGATGNGEEVERKVRRRVSGVLRGEGDEERRGRS